MAVSTQVPVRNRLLATLPPADFSLLEPQLERVPLPAGMRLIEPNTPIEHVYFLDEGITSVVATTPQGRRIEIGIIGSEGLIGMPVLLGLDRTPHACFVQMPGAGLRIRADDLRATTAASATLQQHLLRFVHAFTVQMGQTALANASYLIDERLARRLLMCLDRVDGDDLAATHEFLSLMLGVRRAGVTEALQSLEDRGIVLTRRGQVRVVDRAKLEAVAGDSYSLPEAGEP
jgi:CRP-like cAMP-binding protein